MGEKDWGEIGSKQHTHTHTHIHMQLMFSNPSQISTHTTQHTLNGPSLSVFVLE